MFESKRHRLGRATKRKGKYIVGAICAFSKYMVCDVIEGKTAENVVEFIMSKIVFKFGLPEVITSDNGADFDNELL